MCQQTINESVDHFCNYFEHQSNVIDNLICPTNEEVGVTEREQLFFHKQNLYVCLLDCLSNIRFHKSAYKQLSQENRLRFVRFIKENCDWVEGGSVSLPFLIDSIPPKFMDNPLANYIQEKLNNYRELTNSVNISEVDEGILFLKAYALNEKEEELIERCQHYSILYRYRNYLVHEARLPGGAVQSMAQDNYNACYHQYGNDRRLHLFIQ